MINENQIEDTLKSLFENISFSDEPAGLYDPLRYMIGIGGKRVRPRLCLIAYSLFKDSFDERILEPAAALEVFHSFTLIHDDIMDNSDMRRGMPTVCRKWDDNTAIISGDVMSIDSYRRIAKAPAEVLPQAMELFTGTAAQVCEGQQYDMEFERRTEVTAEEYLEMIRLKTAVLLATALRIGAWIGGAGDGDADRLYDFGINLGLAFQLKDDLLDVYGDERTFGKKIGGDISCNKKTYLLIQARRLATGDDAAELARWLATDVPSHGKIEAVTALYDRLGVRRICEDKMEQYYRQAVASLDNVSVSDDKKQELRKLAGKLMLRNE